MRSLTRKHATHHHGDDASEGRKYAGGRNIPRSHLVPTENGGQKKEGVKTKDTHNYFSKMLVERRDSCVRFGSAVCHQNDLPSPRSHHSTACLIDLLPLLCNPCCVIPTSIRHLVLSLQVFLKCKSEFQLSSTTPHSARLQQKPARRNGKENKKGHREI